MGPNLGPTWAPRGPQNRPKSAGQIGGGSPFFGLSPLKLTLVGKMMLRRLKMPFRGQLNPNMTPTWPCLGPPEGQSDLYFTGVFEHFMFRIFIVLRSLMSPHGAQHGPNMGPKRAPKSAQIGVSD